MSNREYASQIILTLLGKDLDDIVVSAEEDDGGNTKTVVTMNKRRVAKGFKFGASMHTATLTVEEVNDPDLPDWHTMKRIKTRFTITKTIDTGSQVSWIDCVVTDVGEKYSDGDSSRTVKIAFLDRK